MKIYAHFDAEGWPDGYYPEDVFEPNPDGRRNARVPDGAVEIDNATWLALRNAPSKSLALIKGALVAKSPPPIPVDLTAYAGAKRWEVEVGGTTLNGIPVPTDDRAKLLILGAAQTLADDATAPFIVNGTSYGNITGAQFKGINAAVVAHVQNTFATLAGVLEQIAADTITTTEQIDAAFA